jgi:hypothetical protein
MGDEAEIRAGGCLCGAVRYEARWPPLATATCACVNCQKQAGSAVSVIAVLPREALSVTGALTTYEDVGTSGQAVFRRFCGRCGSPVVTDTPAAQAEGIIFIKAGTLDDRGGLNPATHYWTASAQDWFVYPSRGDRLDRQ